MAQTSRISAKSNKIVNEMVVLMDKAKIEIIIEEALEIYRYHERMRLSNEAYSKFKSNSPYASER